MKPLFSVSNSIHLEGAGRREDKDYCFFRAESVIGITDYIFHF